MPFQPTETSPMLFYSYSHRDERFRKDMESSLALLKRNGILNTWSDHAILPGRDIPTDIRAAMENAEVMVFLFSQHFISSDECMTEWERAKSLSARGSLLFRVPIILEPCPWKDVLADDLVKALPDDGKAVSSFRDKAAAWQQVYQGIKRVAETLLNAVSPSHMFTSSISETEFIFGNTALLPEIYVFPTLRHHRLKPTAKFQFRERTIGHDEMFQRNYIIVHGDDTSGKTSLLRHLFLTHSRDICKRKRPILIDLKNASGQSNDQLIETSYRSQYVGDYSLWKSESLNVALVDNLSSD